MVDMALLFHKTPVLDKVDNVGKVFFVSKKDQPVAGISFQNRLGVWRDVMQPLPVPTPTHTIGLSFSSGRACSMEWHASTEMSLFLC